MKIVSLLSLAFVSVGSLFAKEGKASSRGHPKPHSEVVIIGGGMTGALEAYYAYTDAVKKGIPIQITIYEKGPLIENLKTDETLSTLMPSQEEHTQALVNLKKMGIAAWQRLYDEATPQLQAIFQEAHYTPISPPTEIAAEPLADCLDVRTFLPKFYEYMKKAMGTYVAKGGAEKPYFELQCNKEVCGVRLSKGENPRITSLKFTDGSSTHRAGSKRKRSYVFCQGEAIGTLSKLGFDEPSYDGFPTLGHLYSKGRLVANIRCTIYYDSGQAAFSPAVVQVSRQCYEGDKDPFIEKVLTYADSRRTPSRAL